MSHLTIHGLCRLSRDPELIDTKSGTILVKFGVVTNEKYKDNEDTAWNECIAFSSTGENILKYFKKGDMILIDHGVLTQDKWEKDGRSTASTSSRCSGSSLRANVETIPRPSEKLYPLARKVIAAQ